MFKPITVDAIQHLAASKCGPHVSIFLPPRSAADGAKQDGVRLKSHLHSVRGLLSKYWMSPEWADSFLEPVIRQSHDSDFVAKRPTGAAIFCSEQIHETFELRHPVEPEWFVGKSFLVRHLFAQLPLPPYYVLTLGHDRARLYQGALHGLRLLHVPGMPATQPAGRTTAVGPSSRQSQAARTGKSSYQQTATQSAVETLDEDRRAFIHGVAEAVNSYVHLHPGDLVLAGPEDATEAFRGASCDSSICVESIHQDTDDVPLDQLHPLAETIVAQQTSTRRHQCSEWLNGQPERVETDAEKVLTAACQGRVDELFFDIDARLYGSFCSNLWKLKQMVQPPSGDPADPSQDLIELAVVQTLRHDGRVYAVSEDQMPTTEQMVASLRCQISV